MDVDEEDTAHTQGRDAAHAREAEIALDFSSLKPHLLAVWLVAFLSRPLLSSRVLNLGHHVGSLRETFPVFVRGFRKNAAQDVRGEGGEPAIGNSYARRPHFSRTVIT